MRFKSQIVISCLILCFITSISMVGASDVNDTQVSISNDDSSISSENLCIGDAQKYNDSLKENVDDSNNLYGLSNDDVLNDDESYNHIYFDASAENSGDGSINNPFKDFNLGNIQNYVAYDNVFHFAKGVYSWNDEMATGFTNVLFIFNNIKFVGEDSENTIINFNGGGLFAYNRYVNDFQILIENLTLLNASLSNSNINSIYCNNVIFKNSSSKDFSYFCGGSIFTEGNLVLNNCYFINNSANSGGAIYCTGDCEIKNSFFSNNYALDEGGSIYSRGNIIVENSRFENNSALGGGAINVGEGKIYIKDTNYTYNSASSFGGAIVSSNSNNFTLINSNFINDTSEVSAGAIYSIYSINDFYYSKFINCSALFGGAICDLNSLSNYSNLNFKSNKANDGGAIYKFYNSSTINNVIFESNVASNGGAIYLNTIDSCDLSEVIFKDDAANLGEDICYLNSEDDSIIFNQVETNPYKIDSINLTRTSDDYLVFKICDENLSKINDVRYDMRDYYNLSPVKNQKSEGNCWAFAAIAALESCIIKANGTIYDFSEENMKNIASSFSDYGNRHYNTNLGGNPLLSIGYLTSWLGPISDENDIYSSNVLSQLFDSSMHIQNVIFIPRSNYIDNSAIKAAILKYGAVVTSMYYNDSYLSNDYVSYYADVDGVSPNHAVTIVGWDDNYSKNNFTTSPPGNGAFIVRNSWGSDWGEDGYFYVSYYDLYCANENNSPFALHTYILNDTNHYDKNYQYETQVNYPTYYYKPQYSSVYIKNVFVGESDELISAVSTYFHSSYDYEIFINVNGELKHTQKGNLANGYYTIKLTKDVPIKNGDIFEVMFKLTSYDGTSPTIYFFNYGFDDEVPVSANTRFIKKEISFIGIDSSEMDDLYDDSFIAAIKAFSNYGRLNTTLNVTGFVDEWEINKDYMLNVTVKDQYGELVNEGNVTFHIDDNNYTVCVVNGSANKTISFENVGNHVITIIFNDTQYYNPVNITELININQIPTLTEISLGSDALLVGDSLTITTTTNATAGNIALYVNGVLNATHEVNNNGEAIFVLNNLSYGNYSIAVNYSDNNKKYLNSSNKTSFSVSKKTVTIDAENMTIFYGENEYLDVIVTYDNIPLSNLDVKINSSSFKTNSNGLIQYDLANLDVGNYTFTIKVNNSEYIGEKDVYVTVNPKLDLNPVFSVNPITVGEDAVIQISGLDDATGNVTVTVNGENYTSYIVDGIASIVIRDLIENTTAIISYPGNDKYNNFTESVEISVNPKEKVDSNINVSAEDIIWGDVANVVVSLPGDATGNVTVILNGESNVININDTTVHSLNGVLSMLIAYNDLVANNYTVVAIYFGDEKYNSSNATIIFNVGKANSTIDAENATFVYGNEGKVAFTAENATEVKATIDGGDAVVKDGMVVIPADLAAGDYKVVITTVPDDNHNNASVEITVTIEKANSTVSAEDAIFVYGNEGNVPFTAVNAAGVKATIDGEDAEIVDGAVVIPGNLTAGDHTVVISTLTEGNHNNASVEVTVTIEKANSTVSAKNTTFVYGDGGKVVTATENATGVKATIDGKVAVVKDGVVVIPAGLAAGDHTVVISTLTDDNHNVASVEVTVTIAPADTSVSAEDVTLNVNEEYTIVPTTTPKGLDVKFIPDNSGVVSVDENGLVTAIKGGTATITLTVGGGNYVENSTIIAVTVNKINPSISVEPKELVLDYGEESSVNGTLTPAVAGNVVYTSSDENVVTVDAGGNVKAVGAGEASITVSYAGDDKYNAAEDVIVTVKVSKIGTEITVESVSLDLNVEDVKAIVASVNVTDRDVVISYVSSNESVVTVDAGGNVKAVGAGEANITVSYAGDDKYNAAEDAVIDVTVSKIPTEIVVSGDNLDMKVDDSVDVDATLTPADDGVLNYTSSNSSVVKVEGGKFVAVGEGTANVTVSFAGDDKYATAEDIIIIVTVSLNDAGVAAEDITLDVDDNVTIKFTTNPEGLNVTYASDDSGVVTVENGIVTAVKEGTANVTITIVGNGKYYENSTTITVTVNPKEGPVPPKEDLNVSVVVDPITVGDDAVIVVSGLGDATGNVTATVNGEDYSASIVDGVASITVAGLVENATVVVSYLGDDKYNNFTESVNIVVNPKEVPVVHKENVTMDVSVNPINVGEDVIIRVVLPVDASGNVTVGDVTVPVVNGAASVLVSGLAVGNTTLPVVYSGDDKYASAEDNVTVTVNPKSESVTPKEDLNVSVSVNQIVVGEDAVIVVSGLGDASGNVTATVNGKDYTAPIVNGAASITVPGLAENATAVVSYSGDAMYNNFSEIVDIVINPKVIPKENAHLDIITNTPIEGENAIISVNLPEDATGNVTAKIEDKTYIIPINDGKAILTIPKLDAGNYSIPVTYSGDVKYNSLTKYVKLTVEKDNADIISAPNVVKYYKGSERFVVTVTDCEGNPVANKSVNIKINGVNYARTTNSNGTASIALGLNSGIYNVDVIVDNKIINATVTILSTVNGSDIVKVYRNGTQYYATFLDSEGNYLKEGTTVKFNINGVIYERKVSGDKGLAKLNINLEQGEYVITAMNPETHENTANNISVISRLVENNDLTKYYRNASQYAVKVLGDDGRAVGAGAEVTFNINGVLYTRQTNASGIAKLNINLHPGDYIITAEYYGCKVSNDIKVISVLSASDLSMKYRDGSIFTASLVDGQGNPYRGQMIDFNINGMLYQRKTNDNGQARININLMAGQYIITSSYDGTSIANTITISS